MNNKIDVPSKLKDLLANPRSLLVSILTGNTIINVAIGSLAAIITYRISPYNPNLILLQVIVVSTVLIIFGENMHGKTSLLNAVRWALYGEALDRQKRIVPNEKLLNTDAETDGENSFNVSPKSKNDTSTMNYFGYDFFFS